MTSQTKLDRLDLRILSQLQEDASVSNIDLATIVGLSPSPCLKRVRRLEQVGFIHGYSAHICLAKLGDFQVVYTEVTLAEHRPSDFDRFEAGIRCVDEIVECHLSSGRYGYLLKFITRNISHYQDLMERLLDQDLGIEKYFSTIIIETAFEKHSLPIPTLFVDTRSA